MILIDEMQNRGSLGSSCKMISDNGPDELKAFVKSIGLNPHWINFNASVPHIDIYPPKRAVAIAAGAKPISRKEYIETLKRLGQTQSQVRKAG